MGVEPSAWRGRCTSMMRTMMLVMIVCLISSSDCTVPGEIYGGDNANAPSRDLGHTTVTPVPGQPQFDPMLPRNVAALAGESAYLSCRVHNLANKTVIWIRQRDHHILTVGIYTYTVDERFNPSHHEESEEYNLQIKHVQLKDAGVYECQVSTEPIIRYFVDLKVSDKYRKKRAALNPEIYQAMYSDQDNSNGVNANAPNRDLGHTTVTPIPGQPQFDPMVPRNVTALAGDSAYLSCRVHNLANKTVAWIRHRDLHILTVGIYTYTADERFKSSHHKESEEWNLQIKQIQPKDAGVYECQVSTLPITSYFVELKVLDKYVPFKKPMSQVWTPRQRAAMEHEIYQTMYSDQVPTAMILGGPDVIVDKGSTINLTCCIRFSTKPPSYISWFRNDKIIGNDETQYGISIISILDDYPKSQLLIQNADINDSGKYTCISSNAEETSVNIHVFKGANNAALHRSSADALKYQKYILILIFILGICCK